MQMTTFETNKLSIVSCLMWVVMDNAKNGSCCYSPSTPSSGERASEMCCQIDEQQYAVVANRGTENESETRRRIFGFVSYHTGSHSLNENSKMYHTRRRRQNVKNYHKKWLCWEINGLYERICVCVYVCVHIIRHTHRIIHRRKNQPSVPDHIIHDARKKVYFVFVVLSRNRPSPSPYYRGRFYVRRRFRVFII